MRESTLLSLVLAGGAFGTVLFGAPLLADTLTSEPQADAAQTPQVSVEDDPYRTHLSSDEATIAHQGKLLPKGAKSILNTPGTLRHGQYMWHDAGVPDGEIAIWVDLTRQLVSVFRDGHEIGTAVIVYGAGQKASPTGTFPILRRVKDYHSRSYDAPMPYSLFITNDGVALHGSPMASDRATHGCIGLPLEFARKLFENADAGDVVEIVHSDTEQTTQLVSAQDS